MKTIEITEIPIQALKEIELQDILILNHGFESYNRDYFFIIESGTKNFQGTFKILFTHCFHFQYKHKYASNEYSEFLKKSWNDDLIKDECPVNSQGYWWGQGMTHSYPGFSYHPTSKVAKQISKIADKNMFCVSLETEHFEIEFVFHNFKYLLLNQNSETTIQHDGIKT